MLAEGSPQELLERYEKPNLEDVFLDLCMQDGDMETAQVREERSTRPNIIKGIHSVEILRFLYLSSLRFYVKSILWIPDVQKLPFLPF